MPLSMPIDPTPSWEVDFDYEPCDDPNLIPLELNIITDTYAELDRTGYRLTQEPEDGSEPVTYFERIDEMSNSATYTDKMCVPKGRYVFTVYDEFNGLCCSDGRGEYSVKVKGTEILFGGAFSTKSISYTILVGIEGDLSEVDKQWLYGHNIRRKKFHEENGKAYKPLVWSESLAQAALDYASSVTPECELVQKKDSWGQNVAAAPRKTIDQDQIMPDHVLRLMFDRKAESGYPNNNQLSQIAWRGSRHVGCSSLIQESKSGLFCHVSVCKYGRPGNCAVSADNWLEKTLAERSNCGEACPDEGCQ